jgi:hypothetical protein
MGNTKLIFLVLNYAPHYVYIRRSGGSNPSIPASDIEEDS